MDTRGDPRVRALMLSVRAPVPLVVNPSRHRPTLGRVEK